MVDVTRRRRRLSLRQRAACAVGLVIVIFGTPSLIASPSSGAMATRSEIPFLNLSHDLTTFGIAAQNLTPNMPSLDAQPLMNAGLQYAKDHHFQIVTIDPGAYYFLTTANPNAYIDLFSYSDLTIDLAGSTIYVNNPYLYPFSFHDAQRVTLTNFSLDYLHYPYTHVRFSSLDATGRRILYDNLAGWEDPLALATKAVGPSGDTGQFEYWAAFFRNGQIVPGTNRTPIVKPTGGGALNVINDTSAWSQPSVLATLQPGDTIVVTARGGASPLTVVRGDSVVFANISIYASANWAVNMSEVSNSTLGHVNVLPRPGSGHLVGSNADGLHFATSYQNNQVRNCYVARTLDDGIAIDSQAIATVLSQTGPRQLHVRRGFMTRILNNTPVTFVDPATTLESLSAVIVSQNPPSSSNYNEELDLLLDRDIPSLPPATFLVFGTDPLRGAGSTIEDNVLDDIISRGIWVSGTHGVTVRRNRVLHTGSAGIIVASDTQAFPGPAAKDILIESNMVLGSLGPMAQNTGSQIALGAIQVVSTDNHDFTLARTPANHNITIRDNFIADSGRAGMWIGELDGGVVQNNVIVRWYRHPDMLFWGMNGVDAAVPMEDPSKPIALRYSSNVTLSGNVTDMVSTLAGAVNLTPALRTLTMSAATGTIAIHANVPGMSWKATSDMPWLTLTGTSSGTGDGSVPYSVAANASGALRGGTITIAGVAFPVTQSADNTVPSTMSVDKTSLRFGAVYSGGTFTAQTAAQAVRVIQSGTAPVTWTVTSSQPWLKVTPSSGNGSATLSVSVAAIAGLPSAGTVTGSLVFSMTGASPIPGPIDVALSLEPTTAVTIPFGNVDTPTDNSTGVTGAIPFTGWVLDDVEVSRVMICRAAVTGEIAPVDPNCGGAAQLFVGFPVFIDGARPDVAAGYPTQPLNSRAGWGYMVLTNMLPNGGNGTYVFYMYAQDRDGHTKLLGTRTITCDNAHATKPFGAIDTPLQGGVASGTSYVNFGWALTQAGKSIPTDGSTITAVIDGVTVGNVDYNHFRPDIAGLFPGLANSNGGVGFRIIDTSTLTNGLHTISWVVSDSAGAIDGIGSRFFNVANGASVVAASVDDTAVRVDALPLDRQVLIARRGWNPESGWRAFAPGSSGRAVIRGEEVDRFELWLGAGSTDTYRGYLRVGSVLEPLPVGSTFDPDRRVFTWAPGVGFVGAYDLVFVRGTSSAGLGARREVRIILAPKGSGHIGTQVEIDDPGVPTTIDQPFTLTGWAADLDAALGTGVDTVHAWAYPVAGGPPVFIGTPTLDVPRPEVAAIHGDQFLGSGFSLTVNALPPGAYDLAVFPWSNVTGGFAAPKTIRVTIR
jgi:hypothetical protein